MAGLGENALGAVAERELAGVGDASLGEWREWSGRAYHLRRRLTAEEAEQVGPVKDVRGTWEAKKRADRVRRFCPGDIIEMELVDA